MQHILNTGNFIGSWDALQSAVITSASAPNQQLTSTLRLVQVREPITTTYNGDSTLLVQNRELIPTSGTGVSERPLQASELVGGNANETTRPLSFTGQGRRLDESASSGPRIKIRKMGGQPGVPSRKHNDNAPT